MFLIGLFVTPLLHAQDQVLKVDFALRENVQWYEQPWVWIAAAALFLWMLVITLRRNDNKQ